jgi:uncharacterized protein (TIGR03089 family)
VLDPLLRINPAGPRITYYDDATGERIELSTATLHNWAAKSANLLRDELGAGPGSTAGVLLGVWYIGAEVVLGQGDCDIVCCTADRLDEADAAVVPGGEVVALSLDPFGKPIADLPFGITDYATSVRVHGDQISPAPQPGPALARQSPAEVLAAAETAGAAMGLTATDRVLSTAGWDTAEAMVDHLLAVFAAGASLVQVTNPDQDAQERRRITEKVTRG